MKRRYPEFPVSEHRGTPARMLSIDTSTGLRSHAGELCPCGSGAPVSAVDLVCCAACWERIERIRAALCEAGALEGVVLAAGGPLSFAFGLSRKRGTAAMLARARIIRAVEARLTALGRSHAEVRLLLGVDQDTFVRALDV